MQNSTNYYMSCELDLRRLDSGRWEVVFEEIGTLVELEGLCALSTFYHHYSYLMVPFSPGPTLWVPHAIALRLRYPHREVKRESSWQNYVCYMKTTPVRFFLPWLHQKCFYEDHFMKFILLNPNANSQLLLDHE